jgi:hypothetical protein
MSARLWPCLLSFVLVLALPLAWLTSAPAPRPKPAKKLYSDEQVRAAVRYDLARLRPGESSPYLSVVPDGETRPLGEVLKALGFEAARLQEPRVHMFNFSTALYWRVSPSYYLECHLDEIPDDLFDLKDPEIPDDLFDLKNTVYKVQISKRYDAAD